MSKAPDQHVQEMNLKSLRRMDPAINQVLAVVSHVCVYRFDDGTWVKSGIEGSLFVCDRYVPLPAALSPHLAPNTMKQSPLFPLEGVATVGQLPMYLSSC